jgi:hypothetical protein
MNIVAAAPSKTQPPVAAGRYMPVMTAAAVLAASLTLAFCINLIQSGRPGERAVMITGALLGAILFLAPAVYLLRRGLTAQPGTAGLTLLSASAVALLGIYFYVVSSYVFFPADILIWSEGDFVNDIIKFTIGYPMYSAQVYNDSINYVPGAQLLTYFLAWIAGKAGSIPAYRVIQLLYASITALIATLCCRRLLTIAFPKSRAAESWLWNIFWYAALLLMATNFLTNRYVHNLHADSLAGTVNVAAFYLLLRYIETRAGWLLGAMAGMCTVGFFVRQNALIWLICYTAYLVIWGKSWKRVAIFLAIALSIYGAAIAYCFALWGEPFYYWVFYMLSKHPVAPLRSFQHALDAWTYYVALLLGGAAVLRGRDWRYLLGSWLACLLVLASETWTTGIAWMLNHMGPGSVLAGIWFMAGLASIWNEATESPDVPPVQNWIRTAALSATVAFMFSGLAVIRIPLLPLPADAYRYVHDIEKQFDGLPAKRVLLDLGAWMHWKERAVVGDRATSVGDRGYTGAGDFTGLMNRIATKHYAKILVRGYHNFDFVYDYFLFPKSTGIRRALQENYRETGTIKAVDGNPFVKDWAEDVYYFGEISILEPKQ